MTKPSETLVMDLEMLADALRRCMDGEASAVAYCPTKEVPGEKILILHEPGADGAEEHVYIADALHELERFLFGLPGEIPE